MYTLTKQSPTLFNLSDNKTGILIGTVEVKENGYIASPLSPKRAVEMNNFYCACGYIGACTYIKLPRKGNVKQLNLF